MAKIFYPISTIFGLVVQFFQRVCELGGPFLLNTVARAWVRLLDDSLGFCRGRSGLS